MVYMLTFPPLGGPRHCASYYVGYCDDDRLAERIEEHLSGRGAAIVRAAVQRYGAEYVRLVWAIPGDRELERKIKSSKNHKRFVKLGVTQRLSEAQ